MDLRAALRGSLLFRAGQTLDRWAGDSTVVALFRSARVQQAVFGAVLLVSLVSVLASEMEATLKFLSFALLFVLTAALTRLLTRPRSE